MTQSKFLISLVTTSDNQTGDIGRVIWLILALAYVGLSIGHPFNPLEWSAGAACLLGGGSAGLRIKKPTEPGNQG